MNEPRPSIFVRDFHCCLLWMRALEIIIGHSTKTVLSEVDMQDLFGRYRSPWRA